MKTKTEGMDRRSFLKRLVLGAAAALVAPTVLGKMAEAAQSNARPWTEVKAGLERDFKIPPRQVIQTDFGQVALLHGETATEATKRAEAEFCRGVQAGHAGVQPTPGPGDLGMRDDWQARHPGLPDNEVSRAIAVIEDRRRPWRRVATATDIRIPLFYGDFAVTSSTSTAPIRWTTTT